MQFGQFFELIDLLSLVIDQHLEEQSLSFFTDEVMHRFIHFHAILYGVFCGLDETCLRLVAGLVLLIFSHLVEVFDGYAVHFDPLFPHFKLLIF